MNTLQAEGALSAGDRTTTLVHLRNSLRRTASSRIEGTGPAAPQWGGMPPVRLLRSLLLLSEDAERAGRRLEALDLLQEARAFRRYALGGNGGEPLAPLLWLRSQVRLAGILRRMERADEAVTIELELSRLMATADTDVRRFVAGR